MDRSSVLPAVLPLLLLGLPLGGCRYQRTEQIATQGSPAIAGTYGLASIDGHPLPYAPMHPGRPADAPPPPTVVAGSFTVNADSTFRTAMTYRMTMNGVPQLLERQFTGTYVRQAAGYNFTWVNAGQTPVTLQGDTLVLNNEGMLFNYVRRPGR